MFVGIDFNPKTIWIDSNDQKKNTNYYIHINKNKIKPQFVRR